MSVFITRDFAEMGIICLLDNVLVFKLSEVISRSYRHMRKTMISIWDHFGMSVYT